MKIIRRLLLSMLAIGALFVFLNFPLNTRQGIDGVVMARKIPLYAKFCGYFYRDYQYRELSRGITGSLTGDPEKVMAIYNWTVDNIRKKPAGFPTVDDHIWDIVVRGYGGNDQMADVFTTLASYAGYEAFWEKLSPHPGSKPLILSFVKI